MDLNDFCINHFKIIERRRKHRLRCKRYIENNKEKFKESQKRYIENNKEKVKETKKKWKKNNKEKVKESKKIYYKSPNGLKASRINTWIQMGLISNDYNALYEKYLNTSNCDNCNCFLTDDKKITSTKRVLDHNHNTGLFRNILCHRCNVKRG